MTTSELDVLVVGAGNAALTAALAAHESGARVIVLEKAPRTERGGNTRLSGGLFRFAYRGVGDLQQVLPTIEPATVSVGTYPPEAYFEDLMAMSDGLADAHLSRMLADESFSTILWMTQLGVRWQLSKIFDVRDGLITHFPPGAVMQTRNAGIGLASDLFRAIESRRISVRYNTAVKRLIRVNGKVTGVVADTPSGEQTLLAEGVILGAGGFEADREMRRKYLGEEWGAVKVRGSRFDTGEVLHAALDIGAQAAGEWSACHATPIDANAPSPGRLDLTDSTNRLSYPYGILVNLQGERFVDEGETFASHTYAKTGRAVLAQPQGKAFEVFDQQTVQLLEPRYATGIPVIAGTLEELAGKIGLRTEPFLRTVRAFNKAVNNKPFSASVLDGKAATGIEPPKSNWAVALNAPPYVAYPVACGLTFTYGGVKIDSGARVLDEQSNPIPGLFATGEMTGGFFYGNYPGGAGLTRGAVFGRIAGYSAARAGGAC